MAFACPNVAIVDACTMFLCSAKEHSEFSIMTKFLVTGTLSPVRAVSSTLKLEDSKDAHLREFYLLHGL